MLARIRKSMDEKDQGFTLIELLVVMIIIGILAAIAIPVFLSQRKRAVDASIKSDLRSVAQEVESFQVDNQAYPTAGTSGTYTTAVLPQIHLSPNNTVVYTVGANGYCLAGSNPNSNVIGGTGKFLWYSSVDGGLQATPTTAKPTNCP